MRVNEKRQQARIRVTKIKLKILDAIENESRTEALLAMSELMNGELNQTLIDENP
jgi:hypothetical protein